MCLNGDIERQFEFIQQTWAMALQFHGLENEVDPLLTRGKTTGRMTVPTASGPLMLRDFKDCVRMRGGGYFFLPSIRALWYIATLGDEHAPDLSGQHVGRLEAYEVADPGKGP